MRFSPNMSIRQVSRFAPIDMLSCRRFCRAFTRNQVTRATPARYGHRRRFRRPRCSCRNTPPQQITLPAENIAERAPEVPNLGGILLQTEGSGLTIVCSVPTSHCRNAVLALGFARYGAEEYIVSPCLVAGFAVLNPDEMEPSRTSPAFAILCKSEFVAVRENSNP